MAAEGAQRTLEAHARGALAAALLTLPGAKTLLVDDSLYDDQLNIARTLHLFANPTFLREHGVRLVAPLAPHPARPRSTLLAHPSVVFLIRGVNAAAARHAVQLIRSAQLPSQSLPSSSSAPPSEQQQPHSAPPPIKFLVLATPRPSKIVEKVFHKAALSHIPVSVLPLGFLPFDADLVSLDWPHAFRQIVLEGDNSAILATAAALSTMATALNLEFATIRSAGAAAIAVAEELLETHGQKYTLHSKFNDSVPSSAQSSPAISVYKAAPSAFASHHHFSLLQQSSAKQSYPQHPQTPTLADVAGNSSNRCSVNLIIIDRGCDLVTPLLTQGTYEGLLDEAIGLRNNIMHLPISSIVSQDALEILSSKQHTPDATTSSARKRLRTDCDPIFAQLRDLTFSAAASQIGAVASSVKDYYDSRPKRDTAEFAALQNWVQGLSEAKSDHSLVAIHTALAAEISSRTFNSFDFRSRFELEREMIEGSTTTSRRIFVTDAIARGELLAHVLRLCCLWSVTTSGIQGEDLDFIRKEILAMYGLGAMSLLANLERAGVLVRSLREPVQTNLGWIPLPNFGGGQSERYAASDAGSTTGSVRSFMTNDSDDSRRYRSRSAEYSWQFARAALQLVTDMDPEKQITPGTKIAVSAPYSGYTPLSVRLVEAALSDEGWSSLPQIVTHTSLLPPGHATVEHRRRYFRQNENGFDAVIVFVGGIARAEATSVRMAAKACGMKILIATTAVMSSDEFVLAMDDPCVFSG